MTDNDDFTTIINRYFQNDYRERGKIKWNGYFLSDHTSSLTKEGIQRNAITKKLPAISLNDAQDILRHASANYHAVAVQQNIKDNEGNLIPNVTGLINGFSELGVYIDHQFIAFEDIRTVVRKNESN
ncbi:hypothetical protein [Leuconostoc mesenteroides]|uniref:hypothetical protein n=1 Tax=Leuconostoc mesenteroides TaxID=1245 RepID=UPI002361571B|nr:hypothetical protein [Leuconostoc mesenteroides]